MKATSASRLGFLFFALLSSLGALGCPSTMAKMTMEADGTNDAYRKHMKGAPCDMDEQCGPMKCVGGKCTDE